MHDLVALFPENNVLATPMPGLDNPWSDANVATLSGRRPLKARTPDGEPLGADRRGQSGDQAGGFTKTP